MNAQSRSRVLVDLSELPDWYRPLVLGLDSAHSESLRRFQKPPDVTARESAVLILLGDGPSGPDVLLIERAEEMRSHAGQPAFPGGADEEADEDAVATALREAAEETGLVPDGVTVVATLPLMWLPPSGFVVTPVLGYWREPSPVWAADPAEVAAVHRMPIATLVDPVNRVKVSHPSGYIGPGFQVGGMLVWGFTAMLLDGLFTLAGWDRPWEASARVVPFDDGWRPSEAGA